MSSESCFKGSTSISADRTKVGFTSSSFAQNQDGGLKSTSAGGFKPVENFSTNLSNKEKTLAATISTFTSTDANSNATSNLSGSVSTLNKPYSFSFKSSSKDVGEQKKKDNLKQSGSSSDSFHASIDPPPPPPPSSQPARSMIKFSFGTKKK